MTVEQDIVAQYPQFAFMLQDPELHWLLVAHLDPQRGFDSGAFQADLAKTNWWRQHSGSQRQWLQTTTMDPASAEQLLQRKIGDMMEMANEGGLPLTANELRWEATLAMQNNWDDRQMRSNLVWVSQANHGESPGTGRMTGAVAKTGQDIKAMARDYMMPMTDQQAGKYAQDIYTGVNNLDGVKGTLGAWAAASYGGSNPELAAHIKAGGTVRGWFDPQIQAVSQLLEVAPDQVNPLDPKYAPMVNYNNPNLDKPGTPPRMMTVAESQKWARSQGEWWLTANARQTGSTYTSALLGEMGAVK